MSCRGRYSFRVAGADGASAFDSSTPVRSTLHADLAERLMIVGIGFDLVEIERIRELFRRHPARAGRRLFTRAEMAYCGARSDPAPSLAARFAAKEALLKALGTGWGGGASWQEVEVHSEGGAPRLILHGHTRRLAAERGALRAHLSLTHTAELAGAYVVLEGEGAASHPHFREL
jgi:holo-[acyl-carrier protein] synthase